MIFAPFNSPWQSLQKGIIFIHNPIYLRKWYNSYWKCATIDAKKCWFCASLRIILYHVNMDDAVVSSNPNQQLFIRRRIKRNTENVTNIWRATMNTWKNKHFESGRIFFNYFLKEVGLWIKLCNFCSVFKWLSNGTKIIKIRSV